MCRNAICEERVGFESLKSIERNAQNCDLSIALTHDRGYGDRAGGIADLKGPFEQLELPHQLAFPRQ